MTWGQVADLLAPSYTVVCPDLPGFGGSYIPEDTPDSSGSSKRQKAVAMVEVMRKLGHERFSVVGHDRGSYTAFRMAMDHPAQVQKLIVVDCLPIIEHLERADWKFARDWYHWFFFAQAETPERVICADPISWYNGLSPDLMGKLPMRMWFRQSTPRCHPWDDRRLSCWPSRGSFSRSRRSGCRAESSVPGTLPLVARR